MAYAHVSDELRKKLDNKGEKCIFVRYIYESNAYKLYNPLTMKVIININVQFIEEEAWDESLKTIVYEMDVKSTLLIGVMKEEVYVAQPPGYEVEG